FDAVLLFRSPPDFVALHSFPTRRSSDLSLPSVGKSILRNIPVAVIRPNGFGPSYSISPATTVLWPRGLIPGWNIAIGYRHCFVADRKSTRLNSSHVKISYAVFCLKNKTG